MKPKHLAAFLAEEFDVDSEGIELAPSPTGKFNETWFADLPEIHRRMVVRIAPPPDRERMIFYEHRMMLQEPRIHGRVLSRTSCPIPEVLAFAESEPRLDGRDVIVMERIEGEPIGRASESVMEELGARLREVHDAVRAPPERYGYLGEHRPMTAQEDWASAFRVMWHSLLDDIYRCEGHTAAEDERYRERLDREIERFRHFAEPASLLHMDVWAENILVDREGRLAGLIDWDRACWGDPEIEFAVLDYCGVSTPGFWRGYAPETRGRDPRAGDPDAAVRRIFYLLYEVLKYIVIRIARNGNPAGAERYREMARGLAAELDRG